MEPGVRTTQPNLEPEMDNVKTKEMGSTKTSNLWKLFQKGMPQLLPLMLAKFYFRKCDAVGQYVRVWGKPIVWNNGHMIIGERVRIFSKYTPVELQACSGGTLTIGKGVFINRGTTVSACEMVKIGDGCVIGPHCVISDNDFHTIGNLAKTPPSEPIVIEDRVWLANSVIVLKGVTIGQGAVIGAGSVVTKDIPSHSLAAGAPARVIKKLE